MCACVCVCVEGEEDLIDFYKSSIFSSCKGFCQAVLALLPLRKFYFDSFSTFYCLGLFFI